MTIRGIPDPGSTIESIRATVVALKEAVEREVQGTRGLPNKRVLKAFEPLVDIVNRLGVVVGNSSGLDSEIVSLVDRVAVLETQAADHEVRITALEVFHP